jgi:hypothetical protein
VFFWGAAGVSVVVERLMRPEPLLVERILDMTATSIGMSQCLDYRTLTDRVAPDP